ncbi:DUF983 domain-containing protein [Coraliomargarita sinensis]|nr:DUF983 domain-containing protein [Coraliomargarita sinensis]
MNLSNNFECFKRGMMNRCPRCGVGPITKTLFVRHESCPHCKMDFTREDGFYSGAMAINYAMVCGFYLFPMLLIWWAGWLPGWPTIILCFLGSAIMPILTYRYSQCLWLGFYCWVTAEELDEDSRSEK